MSPREPDITESGPIASYGVRKCRGHWHVTHHGEDIMVDGFDGYESGERALEVADQLNRAEPEPLAPLHASELSDPRHEATVVPARHPGDPETGENA